MEKWQKRWIDQHPKASLQEFAVALSQRMIQTSVALMGAHIAAFITVLLLTSLI